MPTVGALSYTLQRHMSKFYIILHNGQGFCRVIAELLRKNIILLACHISLDTLMWILEKGVVKQTETNSIILISIIKSGSPIAPKHITYEKFL
jgi:hypothetical protein